jgi:hypothetical protein
MIDHDDDQLVADYLRRLTAAASALPADRRAELIEEITAHIAEARTAGSVGLDGPPSVPDILKRLGDPAYIVQAAADPFPGGQSESARPPVPASVWNAVQLMYLGATAAELAAELGGLIISAAVVASWGAPGLEERAGILPPEERDRGQPDEPDDADEDPRCGGLGAADAHIRRPDEHRHGVEAQQHRCYDSRPVPAVPAPTGHEDPQADPDQAQHAHQDQRVGEPGIELARCQPRDTGRPGAVPQGG